MGKALNSLQVNKNSGKRDVRRAISNYAQGLGGHTGFYFDPVGVWNRCYGDGKSRMVGKFTTKAMKGTDGLYHVMILQGANEVYSATYSDQPTAAQIVMDIKTAFPTT